MPPPPPPWAPPIPLSPEIGWRDSTEPLCGAYAGDPQGASIWADSRGVFVLVSVDNREEFAPPFAAGASLHFNDGSGWVTWLDIPAEPGLGGADRLGGVPHGPVFIWNGGCPLERLTGADEASCWFSDFGVGDAAPIAENEAVLVGGDPSSVVHVQGDTQNELLELSGSADLREVWADDEGILLLLPDRLLSGPLSGPLLPVAGVPAGRLFSLWAGSRTDVWVGTEEGVLSHFDGASWQTAEPDEPVGISELWSDGENLYFASAKSFGRYQSDSGFEMIFEIEDWAGGIWSMAGNAERGEVYLSLTDSEFHRYACGPTMLIVYDGAELRRF